MTALAYAPWAAPQVEPWDVLVLARQPGLTRITHSRDGVHVRVGDRVADPSSAAAAHRLRSILAADLRDDGSVRLVTRWAPPALVVTEAGPRLLPDDAGALGECHLERGDLLVMCSATVLDAHPQGLVELLNGGCDRIRETDPGRLAQTVLAGSLGGGVAVARRR